VDMIADGRALETITHLLEATDKEVTRG